MSHYDYTKSRVLQWLGIILILGVFGGAYWYFKVYGSTLNKSATGLNTTNLVGYWTFDGADISGTTATDRGTGANNGTLANTPGRVEGKIGQALNFFPNGSDNNSRMTIADPVSGNLDFGSGDFAVSFFMKSRGYSDQTSSINAVLTKKALDTASSAGYAFYFGSTNLMTFFVGNGSSSTSVATTQSIADSTWHHYVGMRSGTTFSLYMDGGLVGTATLSGSVSNSDTFVIGSDDVGGNGNTRNVNADIDEVRVYNAALTSDQIQSLYAVGSGVKINSSISNPQGSGRLDSGLAGYWAMDDGSGTSATDSSVNASTGTLTNGPTWTTGQIGSSTVFDGTNDYISAGTGSGTALTSMLSASAWVYLSALPSNGEIWRIVYKNSSGESNYLYSFGIENAGGLYKLNYIPGGGGSSNRSGTISLSTGQWYHFAVTFNQPTLNFYVNGALNSTQSITVPGGYASGSGTMYIGGVGGVGNTINGRLDEVRVYNRFLSSDEISQLYRLTTPTAVDTGLMAYWSFNAQDMSGSTVYDRSGRPGNSGTASNTTKTEGKIGQALSFNGSSSSVSVSASPSLSTPTYGTYSAWIYTSGDPGHAQQILKENNGSVYGLYLAATTRNLTFGNVSGTRDSGYAIPINTWTFVALTIDNGTGTFYVDGVKVNQQSFSVSSISNAYVYLGAADTGPSNVFNGKLDEIRIHSRALSAAEVKSLYDAGESDKINSSISQPQGTGRLDSGLAGYWKLDDGSGTSATDSSVNGNNGTLTNGPTWITGQIGSAVTLDGINDYITITPTAAIKPQALISLSAWVKRSASGESDYIFWERDSVVQEEGLFFYLSTDNKVHCVFRITGTGYVDVASTTTITDTNWHMVTATHGAANLVTFYIDGVFAGSGTSTTPNTGLSISSALIGARNGGGAPDIYGSVSVDDMRFYSRTLSADEVSQLYRLTSPTGTETSLKGYWSFNGKDISGTTAFDRSGAGNTGTLTNGPAVAESKIGQGLSFDGTDDYVTMGTSAALDMTAPLTVSAWIRPSAVNGVYRIFTHGRNSCCGTEVSLTFRAPGNIVFEINNDNLVTGSVLSVGNWYHVVGTYDQSTASLYVNGTLNNSTSYSSAINEYNNYSAIGASLNAGSPENYFNGIIDEVRIYNRALSASEVAALYNAAR